MTVLIIENDENKASNVRQMLQLFDDSIQVEVCKSRQQADTFIENIKPRKRFIVKKGANFYVKNYHEIAYIFTESRLVFVVDKLGEKYIVEKTLSDLEIELPAENFFRVNRKFIVNIDAIKSFKPSFKGKIALELMHLSKAEVSISQENAAEFRQWIENP